jgi:NADH-quinone oxidoreductase subunit C
MADLSNELVLSQLQQQFPGAILHAEESYGMLTIETTREQIIPLLQYLKDHPEWQINFLTDLCGIHYPHNQGKELGVVYHAHSLVNNYRIRLKVFFPVADPHVPTATGLYRSSNWMERETFDFYGIIFEGHPNLIRILNLEDMDYHPMRKEYPLEDAYRTDKEDQFFGREGNYDQKFEDRK